MKSQLPINRVEMELGHWRSREERFSKLFSFGLSNNRALLKEKLEYYDRIAAKYKDSQDMDERLALRMLRQERNRIEKQLYPNLLIRMLRRLLIVPMKEQIVIRQDNKRMEGNSQALHQQVQRAGFGDLSAKIDEHIRQGHQQFSVPVSYYLNDKERIDHQLSFVKDQSESYQFEGYKTTLYNEAKPNERSQQYFNVTNGQIVNTKEAYNLLSGRYIQRDNVWMQLDFNDKDVQGNFRVKQFHSEYGYDIEKVLQQLPLKELQNKSETQRLEEGLKNGNRVSVSFVKDGNEQRFYIEANPQFKSVNIYDEHSKKITLNTALGNKTMDAMKVTHKMGEQEQRNLVKRNGMRIS